MALSDKFGKFTGSVRRIVDRFFYEDAPEQEEEYAAPRVQTQDAGARQAVSYYAQPAPDPYRQGPEAANVQQGMANQGYARPAYSAPSYAAQQAYARPADPRQPAEEPMPYRQSAQTVNTQYSAQFRPTQRNRRARQEMEEENVVPFPGNARSVQMPVMQEENSSEEPASRLNSDMSMRVMSARSIQDCRAAISLLRAGDIVLVTMDGVTDPGEMRRYVDTLSGACFSLTATITKVSRYGSYLLAPQSLGVFCDSVISQMNSAPRARQNPAQPQGAVMPAENAAAEESAARSVQGDARQPFYMRRPQQAAARPVFEQQPAAGGYVPDVMNEEAL